MNSYTYGYYFQKSDDPSFLYWNGQFDKPEGWYQMTDDWTYHTLLDNWKDAVKYCPEGGKIRKMRVSEWV